MTARDILRKIPGLTPAVRWTRTKLAPLAEANRAAGRVVINHGVGGTTPAFPLKPGVDTEQLAADIATRTWFHSFDFGNGIVAHGNDPSHDKTKFLGIPERLDGMSVLDIGTFDGHYAFEAARRGAADVLATDKFVWEWPGMTSRSNFEFVRDRLDLTVRDQVISVEDISPDTVGMFDVVFFFGVLYHSPDPLGYMKRVRSVTKKFALIETVVDMLNVDRPAMAYYPGAYLNNDASNFFGPNLPALEGLCKDAGFSRMEDLGLWRLHELELTRGEALPTGAPTSGRVVVKAWV